MWKQFLNLATRFWRIAEATDRNRADIEALREELREMGQVVKWLVFEVRRTQENDAHEREKMALRLENELLRFERRLPAPKHKG